MEDYSMSKDAKAGMSMASAGSMRMKESNF